MVGVSRLLQRDDAAVSVAFAQANATPIGLCASQSAGSYGQGGMMQQHHAGNPWSPVEGGFGYMYHMFMGWRRSFW